MEENSRIRLAFTTRLPLAVLIVLGIKNWENRSCCPVPCKGHCGMSVSKSSDETEYANFLKFVKRCAPARLLAVIPTWNQVEEWRGKMVAELDYEVEEGPGPTIWDEGYRYWWRLSNVRLVESPFLVRGDVGMWTVRR